MTRPVLATSFSLVLTQLAATAQADAGYDPSVACAAISARADRGELTVPVALRVLGSDREAEARTVAAIIRHEWVRLPDARQRLWPRQQTPQQPSPRRLPPSLLSPQPHGELGPPSLRSSLARIS